MAEPHDWHLLDAERGIEVRQTTPDSEGNCWEVRTADGRVEALNDHEFDQLRCESPRGLD